MPSTRLKRDGSAAPHLLIARFVRAPFGFRKAQPSTLTASAETSRVVGVHGSEVEQQRIRVADISTVIFVFCRCSASIST